ncbi:hypothetical protein HJC23_003978 [Cyclotella cryptica]|uniref:L-asparaginase N-terminal domain-containing protein n=1 Tax=Cyclotella cryptica TaxID=29204 RepID=A0ABD3QXE8_9STRA|eukprot:CCRYP_001955-RA/>CCRYP_001955-RA protein AED:0.01 eAED:0.01 QI:0/-1/0/1/-1/1/1/0/187
MEYDNHVEILTMGGTIDKDYPRVNSGYAFEFGEASAASRILQMHPNLGLTYNVTSICKKDSLEIEDHDRLALLNEISRIIERNNSEISRRRTQIIITHGTDTMIETAKFIKERLEKDAGDKMPISIAFTGATKPERFIDSDARFNLGSAISVTSQNIEGFSVLICMNGNVAPADKCARLENGVFYRM